MLRFDDQPKYENTKTRFDKNGKKKYIINFKDGQTIEYSNQSLSNNSSIIFDKEGMIISHMANANVTGNPNAYNYITLKGCANSNVDVSSGTNSDWVEIIDGDEKFHSSGNTVKLDHLDRCDIKHDTKKKGWEFHKIDYFYRKDGEGTVKETEANPNKKVK